jgi:hypothetical protein
VNLLYAGVSAIARPARIARAERNMPLTWTLMSVKGRALNGVLLELIFGSICPSARSWAPPRWRPPSRGRRCWGGTGGCRAVRLLPLAIAMQCEAF